MKLHGLGAPAKPRLEPTPPPESKATAPAALFEPTPRPGLFRGPHRMTASAAPTVPETRRRPSREVERLDHPKTVLQSMKTAMQGMKGSHHPLPLRTVGNTVIAPALLRSDGPPVSQLPAVDLGAKNPRMQGYWLIGRASKIGPAVPLKIHDPEIGSARFLRSKAKALQERFDEGGTRLVAIRHGQSEMNARAERNASTLYGRIDSPLTELGRQQAEEAAQELYASMGGRAWLAEAARTPSQLPVIMASPLVRARDTAQALSRLLQREIHGLSLPAARRDEALSEVEVRTDPRLQEFAFGRAEGMLMREVEAQHPESYARFVRDDAPGNDYFHAFPASPGHASESRIDVMNRVVGFLEDAATEHSGRSILVFAHQGVVSSMEIATTVENNRYVHPESGVIIDKSHSIANGRPVPIVG